MTPEQIAHRLLQIEQELQIRQLARQVYRGPNGAALLAIDLDESGYISMNPDTIRPLLIARTNSMLNRLGIVHPQNIMRIAEALLEVANDDDLVAERAALTAKEE